MVRPRLVEEGAPIYGPGSEKPACRVVDDHEMEDDHINQHTSSTGAKPTSSLQAAAKSSIYKLQSQKRSITSTNFEIGGGTNGTSNASQMQAPPRIHHQIQRPSHPSIQPGQMTMGKRSTFVDSEDCHEMEMDQIHSNSHSIVQNSYHRQMQHSSNMAHPVVSAHAPVFTSAPVPPPRYQSTPPPLIPTSCTIGEPTVPIEKMVGVEDHGNKAPLVVLDGANVAHAYGTAADGTYTKGRGETDPDATGIQVAVEYFQSAGLRVLVVLPQYWFRSKKSSSSVAWNVKADQQEVLNRLQAAGLIVASPPADDDDAYALTIARREEARSLRRNGEGPGFVLSNDMFRDAQARDTTGALKDWLNVGRNAECGPGRISFSFADMGTMNDHGERMLDFVPNPRHPLVIWIEGMSLQVGRIINP